MDCNHKNTCYNFPNKCAQCNAISDVMNNYPCLQEKDIVEVVRCKDCMYHSIGYDGDYYCILHTNKVGYCDFSVDMEPNDFCSYGEKRKEN